MHTNRLEPLWLAPEWRVVLENPPFPLRLNRNQTTNVHAAFRGTFELTSPGQVSISFLAAHWFRCWLDGEFLTEGPARFFLNHPEHEVRKIDLGAGRHVIAFHVLHEGVLTRILQGDVIPPFVAASIDVNGMQLPTVWRCRRLEAFSQMAPRRSSLLGWAEICDTRKLPDEWQAPSHADEGWHDPVAAEYDLSASMAVDLPANVRPVIAAEPVSSGLVDGNFSDYDLDVAIGFLRRRLDSTAAEHTGRWWRFDLGRVRLGTLRLRLACAAGATIDTGIAETLLHGRVFPWCYYSEGPTCFVNRYIARGGEQTFEWHAPMGGRYIEVHAQAQCGVLPELISAEFIERRYIPDDSVISFHCSDASLNRIWQASVDTIKSCAEDTLVDPVRERGQWTGDNMTVGIEALAALTGDLRMAERNARQIAQGARSDGVVAALCPGTPLTLTSYALIWQIAIARLMELGSPRELLTGLLQSFHVNIDTFDAALGPDGLDKDLGDSFIDWGSCPAPDLPDLATLAFLHRAIRATIQVDRSFGHPHLAKAKAMLQRVRAVIAQYSSRPIGRLGYHATALLLAESLIPADRAGEALAFLKSHIRDCFPMNPVAPRLRSPAEHNPRLITPYFFQYVLPMLLDRGEEEFALEVIRRCWGWGLDRGMTTIPEVFSDGWSQCHVWSCAPAWVLARYGLGLFPASGPQRVEFRLPLVSLGSAIGDVPLPGNRARIRVEWQRDASTLRYRVASSEPFTLRDTTSLLGAEHFEIKSPREWIIPIPERPAP